MGITTNFYGSFEIDKPLDDETFELLQKLSTTRRMKRDVNKLNEMYGEEDYGVEGEFFFSGMGLRGSDIDDSVIDHNEPPGTQPGLWCQWVPTPDRKRIEWDGREKFYRAEDWISYIIEKILKPRDYKLNGMVAALGETGENDTWQINIKDNDVVTKQGWEGFALKNGSFDDQYDRYCIKFGNQFLVVEDLFNQKKPSWSTIKSDDADFLKINTFDTKKEAEQYYKKVRMTAVFSPTREDGVGLNKLSDVEISKISNHFLILKNVLVEPGNGDHEHQFGIIVDSSYEFENYSIKKLF